MNEMIGVSFVQQSEVNEKQEMIQKHMKMNEFALFNPLHKFHKTDRKLSQNAYLKQMKKRFKIKS